MPLGDRDDAVPSLSRSSDSRLTRLDRTFPAATSTCEGIRTLYPPLFVLATPSFPLPATTPGLVVDRGSKRKGKSSTRNESVDLWLDRIETLKLPDSLLSVRFLNPQQPTPNMPFASGIASKLTVGAKTWRPRTDQDIMTEAETKRAAEMEELKLREMTKKMQTLDDVRKLEERTQRYNELATAHELRAQAADADLRDRAAQDAKRRELARLEMAKRRGLENLSDGEMERIRRERMKAELLARQAGNHAHSQRPVLNGLDLASMTPGPGRPVGLAPTVPPVTPIPPPTVVPPVRMMPPLGAAAVRPPVTGLPPPPIVPSPLPHRRTPSEPGIRMRPTPGPIRPGMDPRLLRRPVGRGAWGVPGMGARPGPPLPLPLGLGRPTMRGPRGMPYVGRGIRNGRVTPRAGRIYSQDVLGERALRLQAERLRRRKLENLDLRARQQALRAQALRDIRRREAAARMRERGLQQREIDNEMRRMEDRERALTEAQLRELRDREHRARLAEMGLQERDIRERMRQREEQERDLMRRETDRLEQELKNEEIRDAELAIRRAMERKEAPPLGITRPSVEELEAEGFLDEDEAFYDNIADLEPRLQQEILNRPRTPVERERERVGTRTPITNRDRTTSLGARTPVMGTNRLLAPTSPYSRDTPGLSRTTTPRMRDDMAAGMTPRMQDDLLAQEQMRNLTQGRGGMTPRLRDQELRRTPSMAQDEYDAGLRSRPSSRASHRGGFDDERDVLGVGRPSSRASQRSTIPNERLGLPMRPASAASRREYTAEELGLGGGPTRMAREREPILMERGGRPDDDDINEQLEQAHLNRELNGGSRGRSASRSRPREGSLGGRSAYGDEGYGDHMSEFGGLGGGGDYGTARSRASSMSRSPRMTGLGMSGAGYGSLGGGGGGGGGAYGERAMLAQEEELRDREMREADIRAGLAGDQAGRELPRLSDRPYRDSTPFSQLGEEDFARMTTEELEALLNGDDAYRGFGDQEQMVPRERERQRVGSMGSRGDYGESPPFDSSMGGNLGGGMGGGLGGGLGGGGSAYGGGSRYARSAPGTPRGRLGELPDIDPYGEHYQLAGVDGRGVGLGTTGLGAGHGAGGAGRGLGGVSDYGSGGRGMGGTGDFGAGRGLGGVSDYGSGAQGLGGASEYGRGGQGLGGPSELGGVRGLGGRAGTRGYGGEMGGGSEFGSEYAQDWAGGQLARRPGEEELEDQYGAGGYGVGDVAGMHEGEHDGLDEGGFTITEHPAPEGGGRIVDRLGTLEALSAPTGMQGHGVLDDDAMHNAVDKLIEQASARGANGIVSLRVNDDPRGGFRAVGDAVVLT